jgi:SAM-dependent methyltransferase
MADTPGDRKVSALLEGVLADVDTTIAAMLDRVRREDPRTATLLDVGCWDGAATERFARRLGARARGIEIFEAQARAAEARGIEVARLDLESACFPWEDGSVDVVVSNQVFEHLKNVWRPMSEIHRVLRPGGWLVLSVPNLASLHNRVLLALGRQPTSIRTLGPHVRGYTFGEIRRFIARDGAFRIVRAAGAGFYPFPAPYSRPLARLWPGASHTSVVLARRADRAGEAPWAAWYRAERARGLQSAFD